MFERVRSAEMCVHKSTLLHVICCGICLITSNLATIYIYSLQFLILILQIKKRHQIQLFHASTVANMKLFPTAATAATVTYNP